MSCLTERLAKQTARLEKFKNSYSNILKEILDYWRHLYKDPQLSLQ
jgi:hypothetical protein